MVRSRPLTRLEIDQTLPSYVSFDDASLVEHGLKGYTSRGCRCEVCRAAWAEYHRDYRRRRALNDGKPLTGPRKSEAERKAAARARLKRLRTERPEVTRAREINSRTRAVGAEGKVTGSQLRALIDDYSGRCAYCHREWEVIDHFVPLARGGTSWVENLRPACRGCNLSKHALSLDEWRPGMHYVPPRTHLSLWDRLLRRLPDVEFGLTDREGAPFRFPTAGWDSFPAKRTEGGTLRGRGFRIFEHTHAPAIEKEGGLVTKVAGVSFNSQSLQEPDFAAGMALVLVPEPDNPHDAYAVSIWDAYRRRRAGWIPKVLSQRVSEGIDSRRLTHAMCLWEWSLNSRRIGIEVLVAPGYPVPKIQY